MAVQTQIQTRRGTAASWTSTNPTLAAGEIGFESDTGKIKIGTGSTAWNALTYTASSTAVTYLFNATAGQTTFSGTDANGLTLAYTVGSEQVYLNGVLQVRGSDYTASNGTSIVLASGALVDDVLNVIAFSALSLSDTYTQAQANARFVQNSGDFSAGKNKIINGDLTINQRGFSSSTSGYNFDRFLNEASGGTHTITAQTFTPGAAPVAGYEATNFMRSTVASQSTSGNYAAIQQRIEDVRTFAGQTITVSFWAKASTGTPKVSVEMQQVFGSGGSGGVFTSAPAASTLSTSWVRYTSTITVPSISGKTIGTGSFLVMFIWVSAGSSFDARANAIGLQNATLDFWGFQVEAGSVATAFQTATGTIQGELAACQRYFTKSYNVDVAPATATPVGALTTYIEGTGVVNVSMQAQFKCSMRIAPTITTYSGQGTTSQFSNDVTGSNSFASTVVANIGTYGFYVTNTTTATKFMLVHYVASAEL
jgi:hypothetical protein